MSDSVTLPVEEDERSPEAMAGDDYEPSSMWLADVLLKGNRMLGSLPGACDSAQQLSWHSAYNKWMLLMASDGAACTVDVQPPELVKRTISSMGAHRRGIAAHMRMATDALTRDSNELHSFVVEDWLLSVLDENANALELGDHEQSYEKTQQGVARLRNSLGKSKVRFKNTVLVQGLRHANSGPNCSRRSPAENLGCTKG